jgi:hypothetical protein
LASGFHASTDDAPLLSFQQTIGSKMQCRWYIHSSLIIRIVWQKAGALSSRDLMHVPEDGTNQRPDSSNFSSAGTQQAQQAINQISGATKQHGPLPVGGREKVIGRAYKRNLVAEKKRGDFVSLGLGWLHDQILAHLMQCDIPQYI